MIKKEKKVKIKKTIAVEILFDESHSVAHIIDDIKKSISHAVDFFDYKKFVTFRIELIYSRKEFDEKIGHKTENWVTAYSFKDHFIIFHPDCFQKFTSHNNSEFSQIITHETSHIIIKQMNIEFSNWLSEGIAQYIAGQKHSTKILPQSLNYFTNNCLFKNSDYYKFIGNQGYEISYIIVNYLIKKYGKQTILKLLSIKFNYNSNTSLINFSKILHLSKDELISEIKSIFVLSQK